MLGRSPFLSATKLCRSLRAGGHGVDSLPDSSKQNLCRVNHRLISTAKTVSTVVAENRRSFGQKYNIHAVEHDCGQAVNIPSDCHKKWAYREKVEIDRHYREVADFMSHDPAAVLDHEEAPDIDDLCATITKTENIQRTITDPDASEYVYSLLGDVTARSTAIAIDGAGTGVMSSTLVKHGAKSLFLFEQNEDLCSYLKTYYRNDPVTVVNQTLGDWLTDEENALTTMVLNSDEFSHVKIIRIVNRIPELYNLAHYHLTNCTPYNLKDVEFYWIANSDVAERVLAPKLEPKPTSRVNRVIGIWNQLFISERIGSLPGKSFYPPFKLQKGAGRKKGINTAVVMRSRLRPEISSTGRRVTDIERPLYGLFLAQCMMTQSSPIIPCLEKWVPGIGLQILGVGSNVFSHYKDLTPQQVLDIFFIFLDAVKVDSFIWEMIKKKSTC